MEFIESSNTGAKTGGKSAPTFDFVSMARFVLKRWWVVALAAALSSMLAFVYITETYKPVYTSGATFVVSTSGTTASVYSNLSTASSLAGVLSQLLNSDVLRAKIAQQTDIASFDGSISAELVPDTNILVLTVTADSPRAAFEMADAIVKNHGVITESVIGNTVLDMLRMPSVPVGASNPMGRASRIKRVALIAAAAAIVLLAVISYMSDTVKTPAEVPEKIDAPLIASIYHERKRRTLASRFKRKKTSILITGAATSFGFVETVKKIRTKVEYRCAKTGAKAIVITSVQENEGKSTIAVNLALALAQAGKRTLLLDADFIKPAVNKIIEQKVSTNRELASHLMYSSPLKEHVFKEPVTGLFMLLNRRAHSDSGELVSSKEFAELLRKVREMFDYVIIDTPPFAVASDAESVCELADAALIVVRQGASRTSSINDVVDTINACGCDMIGCVFNNVYASVTGGESVRAGYGRYGYGYPRGYGRKHGYGYGYGYGGSGNNTMEE